MQRWPAVPTAPNTIAGSNLARSVDGVIIMALFPPNSRMLLPNLSATVVPTIFPILVEPVAEINGTLVSFVSREPKV